MKSKKAFTLIELLAVIVILAIVLSIATLAISGTIENSKNESFRASLSAAARKIKYEIAQGISITNGTLESLNLQGDKLSGFYSYDYTKGQVIFGKNTRNDSTGACLNVNVSANEIINSNIVKCSTLSKGLVGQWKFDGNANDDTMFNNNGTLSGTTLTTDKLGIDNKAYNFNGTSNYIEVPYSPLLAPTSQITCSTWAYRSDWTVIRGTDSRIISKTETGGYTFTFDLSTGGGNGYVSFFVYKNGTGYITPNTSYTGLTSGWHNFVGSFDGRYAKIYIDGILKNSIDTGSINTIGYTYQNSLIIGAEAGPNTGNAGSYFLGKIDDVRVYNRALLDSEIVELYNTYQ